MNTTIRVVICALNLWLVTSTALADETAFQADVQKKVGAMYKNLIKGVEQWGEGEWSSEISQSMMTRSGRAVEEATRLTHVEKVAPRTWIIHAPIVNAILLETDKHLVLIDAGYAAAGPAILKAIRRISDKPIHTVIYTHGHIDHAFGTWALLEVGETPEIIATEEAAERMKRYVTLRGHFAKWLPQPKKTMPTSIDELALPTRTFSGKKLEIEVDGEKLVLLNHRSETAGQLYVWAPERKVIAAGDMWQGFLSNAGNGRREQRYVEDWTEGLREMRDRDADFLLPSHGSIVVGSDSIDAELTAIIDAYQYIIDYTFDALNKGLEKYQIIEDFTWPARFAEDPRLKPRYSTAQDIVKVIVRKYTGWWDGLPADWNPAPMKERATEIVHLAGGIEALTERVHTLIDTKPALALSLAQWAYLAQPDDTRARQAFVDALYARGMEPGATGMEVSSYVQWMRKFL